MGYSTVVKLNGSEVRRRKRVYDPSAFTRAQACKFVAGSMDVELVQKFSKHPNEHVKRLVSRRLDRIDSLLVAAEKRSAAAKKAAATRAAKKAASGDEV